MGSGYRPQYVFRGSDFQSRPRAPRPPMYFPPGFPVDIFITKELFKNGMKAIHTEMKKHENFQQNMYNKLHDELQAFIKCKAPAVPVSEPTPVRPPVSAEPSIDDLKS